MLSLRPSNAILPIMAKFPSVDFGVILVILIIFLSGWCGVAWALFALASPYGWLAIACPLLMFYVLFRVTGIPATEAQALRSKRDAYREYQQSTSAFVPWFKKLRSA